MAGKGTIMTPKEVLALCREKEVRAVDLRFMDFPGLWQHFTIPVSKLEERVFSKTAWATTARVFAAGRRSTKATCSLSRNRKTAFLDPFTELPTLGDESATSRTPSRRED